MKNDPATPRPWRGTHYYNDANLVLGKNGEHVALFNNPWDWHMAVRAVNSHDALLEACKLAKKLLAESDRYNDGCKPENDLMVKLEIAIANAEGGK